MRFMPISDKYKKSNITFCFIQTETIEHEQ